MNANVSIYQDSVKDSSGILTSESNEIGSLKIIMPDKLNQLTARSSYICHIDDFVKGNKDYYGFDIQSDREMEYDYELIINKIKHINNNTGKHEYISIFNNFPVLGFMLCQIANLNDLRILGGYRYSIRLKNISERDIVIDYINSIFITYDNICIYKVDNIDVRCDIPREFIDDLNALYKTIIDNIFGYRFSIRVVTGYDNCIVDNIEVFVPVKSNMDISNNVSNMFRKFLNAKRIDFFNLISVFEYLKQHPVQHSFSISETAMNLFSSYIMVSPFFYLIPLCIHLIKLLYSTFFNCSSVAFFFGNFPCHFPGTTTSRPSGLVASLPHSLHSPMPLYGCSSLA